jgi:hypothetical protein
MEHGQVKSGITVAIAGLDAIPHNYASFKDVPAFAAPHIFKPEWFNNRQDRVGQTGEVQGFCAGHVNAIWKVLHGDNSIAIYHHSELVLPANLMVESPLDEFTEEVAIPIGSKEPFSQSVIRGITVEAYIGLEPTQMEGDTLIVPFVGDKPPVEQFDEPLHKVIRDAFGDRFHNQIAALGEEFARCAAKHIDGPADDKAAPFKSVVFVNGVEPPAEAIVAAFQCAHEATSKTVILPILTFFPGFTGTGTIRADKLIQGVIRVLSQMADLRGIDFEVVKVVF